MAEDHKCDTQLHKKSRKQKKRGNKIIVTITTFGICKECGRMFELDEKTHTKKIIESK